jgi:hypothetical protein
MDARKSYCLVGWPEGDARSGRPISQHRTAADLKKADTGIDS